MTRGGGKGDSTAEPRLFRPRGGLGISLQAGRKVPAHAALTSRQAGRKVPAHAALPSRPCARLAVQCPSLGHFQSFQSLSASPVAGPRWMKLEAEKAAWATCLLSWPLALHPQVELGSRGPAGSSPATAPPPPRP